MMISRSEAPPAVYGNGYRLNSKGSKNEANHFATLYTGRRTLSRSRFLILHHSQQGDRPNPHRMTEQLLVRRLRTRSNSWCLNRRDG